jgi:hypothetical protein
MVFSLSRPCLWAAFDMSIGKTGLSALLSH